MRANEIDRPQCGLLQAAGTLLALAFSGAGASSLTELSWSEIERRAAGQTVYFNAWGGDLAINRYLDWAAGEIRARHGVRVVHVKVTDIAESVSRIRAERTAGRDRDGTVDLLWINGENFAAMRRAGLLWGPWAETVPNASLIDWRNNPTTRIDATLPAGGYELPWGTAAFTLFYDSAHIGVVPNDPGSLLAWIEAHPGRFSYPQPPAFLGTAFLKQMLLLLCDEPGRLQQPPGDAFGSISAPLWQWLDRAHVAMWRGGRLFPASGPAQRELVAVGELHWLMSYNPAEAARAVRQRELPASIRGVHFAGALANSHFLAIPYNASAREGALVVTNFLLSPAAQARKARTDVWGDPTVLDSTRLSPGQRVRFDAVEAAPAMPPPPAELLPEPHPAWTARLERAWLERYTRR